MNSFGLGLILNFVDNASSGMSAATNNFNRMSATADSLTSSVSASATELAAIAFSLSAVGDTFTSIGESVMGVFAGITQSVINTGGQMLNYRMQMTALYGSAEAGEAKMEEIKQYAMSSVFAIESLIPAVTMMKAVGIEALEDITTSSGSATQKLLDYASDLAAMMPNMRNVYGTGVEAAMGAFKEYIAEGNAMSLKRGAGLDITQILGEEKGSTIAERTQQVADLIDKLNIVGYTASLAGTPTQRLSNMQDALFNSLSKIADSGVFEVYCGLLETLSNWVFSLVENEETFNTITGILADTISTLLTPLQKMLDWVVANSDAIIEWVKENPELTKNILLTVAAVGAFLIVGGSLLKLLSSIAFAVSGFQVLRTLPALFGKLAFSALPFIALAGLLYTAWDKNLGGVQDKITWFVQNIVDIISLIADAWSDNTLSEERYNLAESLGILPLIEDLLMLKYYWGSFVKGFKQGFESFYNIIDKTFDFFGIDISEILGKVKDFFKSLTEVGQEGKWENIGKTVAGIASFALSLRLLLKVVGLFKGVGSIFSKIPFLGGKSEVKTPKKSGLLDFFTKLAKAKPTTILKGMLNLGIIIGGVALIAAGVMAVSPYLAQLTDVKSFLKVVLAITVLGLVGMVLSNFAEIAGKIKVSTTLKGLANMAIMLGGMSALFAVVGLVSNLPFDPAKVLDIAVVLGVLGVVGVALSVLAAIIGLIPVAVVALGLANMAIIIGGLTALYTVIGLVTKLGINPTDVLDIAEVMTVLGVLGGILSAFAGIIGLIPIPVVLAGIANIVLVVGALTELAVEVSKALPTIGGNISKFAESIKPAFDIFASLGDIDYEGLGSFFTSFGAFMLQLAGDKVISFFTGGTDLNKVAKQLVDFANSSQDAFITISQFPAGSIDSGLKVVNLIQSLSSLDGKKVASVGDKFSDFASSLKKSFKDFPTISDEIVGALNISVENATTVFDTLISRGSAVGKNLMQAIADSIASNAYLVKNALQSAIGSIRVTASPTVVMGLTNTPNKLSPTNLLGLSTGGYVKEEGIAALHPDEVVVNDDLTKKLRTFLSQYSPATAEEKSTISQGETKNDYSVTFEAGSVVIQLVNATEAELEKAAEKLMKIIARKQQLRAMAIRA